MSIVDIKVRDLETGEVHRLKTLTKTYCGIDIKKNEANWCIVGTSASISCTKKQCESPMMPTFNKILLRLSHCI